MYTYTYIYIYMIPARGPEAVLKQLLCWCNWGDLRQLLRLLGLPCQPAKHWISLLKPFHNICTFYVHMLQSQQFGISV